MSLSAFPLLVREEIEEARFPETIARGLEGREALHTSILVLAPDVASGLARGWTGWRGSEFEGTVVLTSSGQLEVAGLRPDDCGAWARHLRSVRFVARTIGGEARLVGSLLRQWRMTIDSGLDLKVLAAKRASGSLGPGWLRPARAAELDTASAWIGSFLDETSQGEPDWVRRAAMSLMANGDLYFWGEGNAPLSMVAVVAATARASRLSLAYTPPRLRGRGYATSCMRAITIQLLQGGAGTCCVHVRTDAGTPQRLYRRAGYAEVGERLEGAIS